MSSKSKGEEAFLKTTQQGLISGRIPMQDSICKSINGLWFFILFIFTFTALSYLKFLKCVCGFIMGHVLFVAPFSSVGRVGTNTCSQSSYSVGPWPEEMFHHHEIFFSESKTEKFHTILTTSYIVAPKSSTHMKGLTKSMSPNWSFFKHLSRTGETILVHNFSTKPQIPNI